MTTATTSATTQVYRVYIKASPEAIWEAITKPEWTARYGYAGLVECDLRVGGALRIYANEGMKMHPGVPDVITDGEVLDVNPPWRLVVTWRMLMTPELAAEGFTRLTYDLAPGRDGVTRLTVTHELAGAPLFAAVANGSQEHQGAGGGWSEILSGLKTLLETGEPLPFQSGRPLPE